ncbi:WXG100 family type VII secretion target [Actinoplanes sp. CA-030573]|uniref:WXG100 family type VII secretion target n=1 Tax=Actinoplanes sp. CA-030573 TaxID=3239898 RepID=UPI003D918A3F
MQSVDPRAIEAYANELSQQSDAFRKAAADWKASLEQLTQAWPSGAASPVAQEQIANVHSSLTSSADELDRYVAHLEKTKQLLEAAIAVYRGVVGSTNPIVAGLLASPHPASHHVGRVIARTSTNALQTYFSTAQQWLQLIGLTGLGTDVMGSLSKISADLGAVTGGGKSLLEKIQAGLALVSDGKQFADQIFGSHADTATAAVDPLTDTTLTVPSFSDGILSAPPTAAVTSAVPSTTPVLAAVHDLSTTATAPAAATGMTAASAAGPTLSAVGDPTSYNSGYAAGYQAAQQTAAAEGLGGGGTGLTSGYGPTGLRYSGADYGALTASAPAGPATNTWVPIEPGQAGPGSVVTGSVADATGSVSAGGGSGWGTPTPADSVVVTSDFGNTSVSVQLPTSSPMDLQLTVDTNGPEAGGLVSEKISIDADHRVSVT